MSSSSEPLWENMARNLRTGLFVLFLLCSSGISEDFPIYYSSDISKIELNRDGEPGEIILQGNVKVLFQNTTITCDKAKFNRITGDITAEGSLSVQTPQGLFNADSITYNLYEEKGVLLNVSFSSPPLYGKANKAEKKESLVVLDRGYITTCDLEKPHYRISAERIEYVQDDYIKAERMKLIFGERFSLLYLPRFTLDVKRKEAPFIVGPRYSKRIGEKIDFIFSHRAGEKTDAVVRERISLGSEGWGLGLETFSDKTGYSSSGFVHNRWDDRGIEAGGFAEFGRSYSSPRGNGRVILDWRWMYDNKFFNDFFNDEFIKKSKTYNYFSYTHNFGNTILNLNFRESASEDFLKVEKLPELQLHTPYVQLGEIPLFLENDLCLTNFYTEEENCIRAMDILTVKGRKNAGYLTFAPYVSLGGVSYNSDVYGDRFNLVREVGTKVSATVKKSARRYTGYFTPAVSLFYRGINYKRGEIKPFDRIEEWDDGRFLNLQTDWAFMGRDGYLGRISIDNAYSFDTDEFDRSFLKYDLQLTPHIYVEGENEWDINDERYRFGVNDIVFQYGRYDYSIGNRYNEEDDTSGIAGRFEHRVNQNWRYALEMQYDINSGSFTRKSFEVWKKLHCWEMNFSLTVDENDFSFFIIAYPIFL